MKKFKISILMLLIGGACFAQQTTTTTTTTTNSGEQSTPAVNDNSSDNNNNSGDCAQGYIGIRFLPTLTSLNLNDQGNGTVKTTFVLGYGIGGYLGYNFNRNVGVQGEVLYSSLSQKYEINNVHQRIELSYINIPLLLSLNTNSCGPVNLNLVVGPQLGINTGSSVKTEGGEGTDTVQAVIAVRPGDLGFAYGAGIDFRLGTNVSLGIGFRGVYGLLDISNHSNTTTTNQYYILDRSHVKTYAGYIGLGVAF